MARAPLLLLVVLLTSVGAGCAGSCTEFPTRAELSAVWAGSEADLAVELGALGWSVAPPSEEPHTRRSATLAVDGGEVRLFFEVWDDEAGLEFFGPTKGTTTEEEARAELAPSVGPVAARLGAEPRYFAGSEHCGAV